MKITSIKINEYKKSFLKKTMLGNKEFEKRKGWYLRIYSDELCGMGEGSPIPDISQENHEEVGYALNGFKLALEGIDYKIELEELLLLSEVHGFNIPSAKFAIQSAIYDLFSKSENKSVAKYLNQDSSDSVNINSIYDEQSTINIKETRILKVKVNQTNLFDIREKIDDILKIYPTKIKLRLDFNGILDLPRSIRICKELKSYDIDYIEQPLPSKNINDLYDLRMCTDIPIAVDESLSDYESAVHIIDEAAANVLIIKPTVTGSFSDIKKIVDLSNSEGLKTIITSSFETSVAQFYILNLIAALNITDHCGVFNIRLFNDDIFPPLNKDKYKISESGIGYEND